MKSLSERAYQSIIGALLLLVAVLIGVLIFSRDSNPAPAESLTPGTSIAITPSDPSAQPTPEPSAPVAEPIDYQLLFPELCCDVPPAQSLVRAENTVYLTFDGAPGGNTQAALDALDAAGVKATFFVHGCDTPEEEAALREIAERGHALGLSSYSQSYQAIYQSVESYLADFQRQAEQVRELTGESPAIFRFPGGSVNAYNSGIYRELIAEMLRRGYVFFDWDSSGADSRVEDATAEAIRESVADSVEGKSRSILRLNIGPGKEAVIEALPLILGDLETAGYALETLDNGVLPVVFSYNSAP